MNSLTRPGLFIAISVFLAGLWTADAQLPVPMLPMTQSGTSASQTAPSTTPFATSSPQSTQPAVVPGLLNGYVPDATYKFRVGDIVSFQVLEDRIWNPQNAPQSLVVEDSGDVEVPYIGRIKAVGKTSKELAADIKAALENQYYKQATVSLSINVVSPVLGRVYIWGQVRQQGGLDIQVNENLTAGNAILRAGGFADFANKKKVKVVRTDASGKTQTFELDMQQILEQGKVEKDIVLQPNDLVIVPTRLVNF